MPEHIERLLNAIGAWLGDDTTFENVEVTAIAGTLGSSTTGSVTG